MTTKNKNFVQWDNKYRKNCGYARYRSAHVKGYSSTFEIEQQTSNFISGAHW